MHVNFAHNLIVYDGNCNVCSFWVNWLRTKSGLNIQFVTNSNHKLLSELDEDELKKLSEQVLYIHKGKKLWGHVAIEQVSRDLGSIYKLLYYTAKILPVSFKQRVYKYIAQNRYLLSGNNNSCSLNSDRIFQK